MRLVRAIACIKPWPCIGLSTYSVWTGGASKPVNHMSRTITNSKGSSASLKRFSSNLRWLLSVRCGWKCAGSAELPVITTLSLPLVMSLQAHSGRSLTSSS